MHKKTLAWGSWLSSIKPDHLVSGQIYPSQLQHYDNCIYWLESRPEQKGRSVLLRARLNQQAQNTIEQDLLPESMSVRSRVHEYGGSSYRVCEHGVLFVNLQDQQIYLFANDGSCRAITAHTDYRFVDIQVAEQHNYLICIAEHHISGQHEPDNSLVSINIKSGKLTTLASGEDFYASPCISPVRAQDHSHQICWLSWSHPDMPWDHTRLWVANLQADGTVTDCKCARDIANESIFQPQWSTHGKLYYVADQTGWWNLYEHQNPNQPLIEMHAEFGQPQWVFGMSSWDFISSKQIACTYIENGNSKLATINLETRTLTEIDSTLQHFDQLRGCTAGLCFIGGAHDSFPAIYHYKTDSRQVLPVQPQDRWQPDPDTVSHGQPITFATSDNQQAHAFYYPPVNPYFSGPADESPPLIVISHGGPTACSDNSLALKIQFWTSRGFAVCDVNYRGSTGFGRAYREALNGKWGIYDVDDCVYAARHLAQQNLVDHNKLIIRGSSAGGYSVLCALTFHDTFKAGASYYGIGDLATLAEDTHKFEARYLDRLVGPWPEAKQDYAERSPLNAVDQLDCAVIFFQGLEDKVVPPNQAEQMVNALKHKSVVVGYVTYAEEQHGFRQAATIKHSLQTELAFYGKVFGFEPAECDWPQADPDNGIGVKFYND